MSTDTDNFESLTRDIRVCPNCLSKLEYDYVRYHHIGKAHCPNCDFKNPDPNYHVTKLDFENNKMVIDENDTEVEYDLVSDNIINIYNMLAAIIALKQLGLTSKQINESFAKLKIVETRYSKEEYEGYQIVTQLAKGMNPIACSRAFDYARKEPGKKAVIVALDDAHEEAKGSENTAWQYDTDYELLKDESIKQVIIAGPRYLDGYIRLLMADIPKEKIVYKKDLLEAPAEINIEEVDSIFILHDLYLVEETKQMKQKVKDMIYKSKEDEKVEE